ncbi:transposon Ty3-I Gag-Pol polyprotein [Trichonephila clavipes]|nr:transposon Ty3-I Gag-Pol polyprotein [Trichonephila clavipes]
MFFRCAENRIGYVVTVLDESRSFFRVHTGYFSNIPCIKAEFIASWACSQSSVVSSSKRAPRVIITDRGAVFRSRLVSSLVDLCNIDHRFTTAYHPQTNGLTERFNKTLADMLSMYVDVEQKNWDEILPFVTFAYNTAKQETTGFTPFYLLHGREAETTLDTMLPFCPNDFDDNNITKIAARAEESRQLARVHTLRAQDKDRRRYDSKHQMVSLRSRRSRMGLYSSEKSRSLRKTLKKVLDESRSFFRVHTGYFSNIPKCIKAEFIASWACSQSSVVSSSKR